MKRLFTRFSLFLIPIACLATYMEYHLDGYETTYHFKKKQLSAQQDSIATLVLGNSHVFEGINPDYLDDHAFNLANSGQDLYTDYQLIKTYLDSLPKVKTVIISISYNTLYTSYKPGRIGYERSYFYKRVYNIQPGFSEYSIKNFSWISLYGFQKSFDLTFYARSKSNINRQGYDQTEYNPKQKSSITDQTYVRNIIRKFHKNMSFKELSTNTALLENIISLCKEQDVTPVIITLPVYKTYFDLMEEQYYSNMQKELDRICKVQNVRYLNLQSSELSYQDFRNSSHLSKEGAEKITTKLNRFLKDE